MSAQETKDQVLPPSDHLHKMFTRTSNQNEKLFSSLDDTRFHVVTPNPKILSKRIKNAFKSSKGFQTFLSSANNSSTQMSFLRVLNENHEIQVVVSTEKVEDFEQLLDSYYQTGGTTFKDYRDEHADTLGIGA